MTRHAVDRVLTNAATRHAQRGHSGSFLGWLAVAVVGGSAAAGAGVGVAGAVVVGQLWRRRNARRLP